MTQRAVLIWHEGVREIRAQAARQRELVYELWLTSDMGITERDVRMHAIRMEEVRALESERERYRRAHRLEQGR